MAKKKAKTNTEPTTKTRGVRLRDDSLEFLESNGVNLSQLVQKTIDKMQKSGKCSVCGSIISKK